MCGIAGIISRNTSLLTSDRLQKMGNTLSHRGEDGEAIWINPGNHCGFAHRRLAIIDLSPFAAQPMHRFERYTIVYNGEIYNYLELRDRLKTAGYNFTTASDTEVILAAFDHFREKCIDHFDGMFAFAIWDEKEQSLFAARDRFGEKPFYYNFDDKAFYFGSERKALWSAGIPVKTNGPLLLNYLVTGQTQTAADKTITYFQETFSLPPAHYMTCSIQPPGSAQDIVLAMHCYWDLDKEKKISISPEDAVDKFRELFFLAVNRRLRSDVPVGTSLSGGLDSSSIVAAIAAQHTKRKTFSAIFPGYEKDESKFSEEVSRHFGVQQFTTTPDGAGFVHELDKLCYHHEEPFNSASVYAQFKVFALAKQQQTKVLLDGQGADEILAGYSRYIHWYLQEILRTKPGSFWGERKKLLQNGSTFKWGPKNIFAAFLPAQATLRLEKREIRKLRNAPDLTTEFKNEFLDPASIVKPMVLKLNDILYFNTCQLGLEELLRYADRNSMAFGRETRLPFLSHELVEFVFSLPSQLKINGGWSKWLLRESLKNELPPAIAWRKDKIGYEPPQKAWMDSDLFKARAAGAKKKLVEEKILRPQVLDKKIQPQDAYAAENADLRYVVAAACFNGSL